MFLERIIYILSNWPIYGVQFILPFLVVFFGLKNLKFLDAGLKLLLLAYGFWIIFDLGIWYIAIIKANNYWLSNIQEVVFSCFVILGFGCFFKTRLTFLILALLVIEVSVYMIPNQSFENYMVHAANRIIYLAFSIYFFFKTLEEMEVPKITSYPWFWIFAGFLIYSASTVITYILSEFTITVLKENLDNNFFKTFNITFSFILYLFSAIGFFKARHYYRTDG